MLQSVIYSILISSSSVSFSSKTADFRISYLSVFTKLQKCLPWSINQNSHNKGKRKRKYQRATVEVEQGLELKVQLLTIVEEKPEGDYRAHQAYHRRQVSYKPPKIALMHRTEQPCLPKQSWNADQAISNGEKFVGEHRIKRLM